jgi:hypothetical protein
LLPHDPPQPLEVLLDQGERLEVADALVEFLRSVNRIVTDRTPRPDAPPMVSAVKRSRNVWLIRSRRPVRKGGNTRVS